MSTIIDDRVVQMGLENEQFEKGIGQTLKSLDNLEKGLKLEGATKGLTDLSTIAGRFSVAPISEGISSIANHFTTMGIIGMAVIQNLTNAAITFGKKLVTQFTSPITAGFQEFETQTNAIQTILANTDSKGTTLDQVVKALDELNLYSDKTIYNFTEMTKNIGTFTAAGTDLDKSVAAIKGIANLAAVSGSNSQQASTAMYQLSQALASGTVKLMDWNSVVNAGMGGQVFQDALKETARVHGVSIDNMIKTEGSFRETLQKGWLTSDILLETLSKFTGDLTREQLASMGYTEEQIASIIRLGETANDAATKVKTFSQLKQTLQEALQSGWSKSWQIIIGDFNEAKAFFTEISDTLGALIGASSDARNQLLQQWKDFGGRSSAINTLRNVFQGLLSIAAPIKEAFTEIFPPATALDLYRLSLIVQNLSSKLVLSSENADRVKRIFAGLFSVFSIVKDVIFTLIRAIWDLGSALPFTGSGVLEFLAGIGDFLVGLKDGTDVAGIFQDVIETISQKFKEAKYAVLTFSDSVKNNFAVVAEQFELAKAWVGGLFEDVDTSGMTEFFDNLTVRFAPFETLAKGVWTVIKGLFGIAKDAIPTLASLAVGVANLVETFVTYISEQLGSFDYTKAFDTINGGLFAALLLGMKQFLSSGSGLMDSAGGFIGSITGTLDGVRTSLEAWQANLKAKTLLTLAGAIAVVAISLIALSLIDSERLTTAIAAMTALFVELVAAQATLGRIGGAGVSASVGLIGLAGSLLIMSAAVSVLAGIKQEDLTKAIGATYALLTGIVLFSKVISGGGNMATSAVGLLAVSASLLIMASVVEKLGQLDQDVLAKGLLSTGAMLAGIAGFMKLVDGKSSVSGLGILIMAAAVLVMAEAIERLGKMEVDTLSKGLATIGAVLAEIAAFSLLTANGANLIASGIGLVIFAGAMLIMAKSLETVGELDLGTLQQGLAGIAAALGIVAVAMRLMPKDLIITALGLVVAAGALIILAEALTRMGSMSWEELGLGLTAMAGALLVLSIGLYAMSGTMAGSLALIASAGALFVLAGVMSTLGSMPLSEIGIALLALAGIFVILGVAGYILTPVVPTLLGLAGAILLIGVGAALVGVGLLAFSTGLAALAVSGAAGALAIVAMVTTLLGILPLIVKALFDALILFARLITEAAPVIGEAITALFLAFLKIIIDVTPDLLVALGILLAGLIQLIVDVVPDFIAAVILLLTTLLTEIAANAPTFIQAGWDILLAFLQGIADNIADVVDVVTDIVTEFLGAVADNLPDIIQAGVDLLVAFLDGITKAIEDNGERINTAVGNLCKAIIDGLIKGIVAGAASVTAALVALVMGGVDAVKRALGINSPSKVYSDIGEGLPEGLYKGVVHMAGLVDKGTALLADKAKSGMEKAVDYLNNRVVGELDANPYIRPVMDLTNVMEGKEFIDGLIGTKTLNLVPVAANASRAATYAARQNGSDFGTSSVNKTGDVNFTQINNSPKALSRAEIYRQTRNQISTLKQKISEGG